MYMSKYAQYAPVDHPATRQETSEPGAYCRRQLTPRDCFDIFHSIYPE
jgi:hypothetical protein